MSSHSSNHHSNSNPEIKASELLARLDAGEAVFLLDVREPMEYHTFNIGGTNIPVGKLIYEAEDLELDKDDEVIVLCQAGVRSKTAQAVLRQHGYQNIRNLTGGLLALRKLKS
jgi:adenylyltransferase/sulfurtransferase